MDQVPVDPVCVCVFVCVLERERERERERDREREILCVCGCWCENLCYFISTRLHIVINSHGLWGRWAGVLGCSAEG